MPGARLDFSYEERTEIAGALAPLPAGAQFWSTVATACHLGDPVKFAAIEILIRHDLLDPNLTVDGNTLLQTVCLHGQNAWQWVDSPLTLEQRITSLVALGARIDHPELPALDLLRQTWERDDLDGRLAAAALIANGADPLQRDTGHYTLLHRAAETGNMPLLRGWRHAGLAMDLQFGPHDRTALHLAAGQGHHEVLRFLVTECGVDVNARTLDGSTALHEAAWHAHAEATKVLLDLQANLHCEDRTGHTPLMIAVVRRSESLRALLIRHGADPHVIPRQRFLSAAALYEQLNRRPWPDGN